MKNFAINGFGRIGRLALRVWHEKHQESIALVAINTSGSMDLSGWAHLLKYDTIYGPFKGEVTIEEHQGKDQVSDEDPLLGHILLDNEVKIPVLAQRDPEKLPWGEYKADIIVEATGVFRTEELAKKHMVGGAKQVLLSAPGKEGVIETVVLGVNEKSEEASEVYSVASCTTNCTAPAVAVIHEALGVEKAFLTTIHAYTDGQNLQDGSHKDLRRARAAALNIIPTTTGAAKATTGAIPELQGKFDGMAIRVPVITGSLSDISLVTSKPTSVDEVNKLFTDAELTPRWKGILATTTDPIVSSDVIGRPESSLVDLSLTQVVDGDLVKVITWYDNEWGYTNRLVEFVTGM